MGLWSFITGNTHDELTEVQSLTGEQILIEERVVEPEGMFYCGLCGWMPVAYGTHPHNFASEQEPIGESDLALYPDPAKKPWWR